MLGTNELTLEIMALFVLRRFILQTRMCRRSVGLDVWVLVGPFVYSHTSCMRTVKAPAKLCGCTGSPEPLLVVCAISTIIPWAGSNGIISKKTDLKSLLREFAIKKMMHQRNVSDPIRYGIDWIHRQHMEIFDIKKHICSCEVVNYSTCLGILLL